MDENPGCQVIIIIIGIELLCNKTVHMSHIGGEAGLFFLILWLQAMNYGSPEVSLSHQMRVTVALSLPVTFATRITVVASSSSSICLYRESRY